MKATELAAAAGVCRKTILRLAPRLGGKMLGGSHGWEFPENSVRRVHAELAERQRLALRKRRKTMAENGTRAGFSRKAVAP